MRASMLLKIAALMLAALSVLLTASCSLTGEETEETTTERPAVTLEARPVSAAEVLDYYNHAVNAIKTQKPGVSSSFEASVHDVDTGDCPEAEALIQFAKNFSDALEEVNDEKEYGSDLTDFLPLKGTGDVSRLTEADVASAEINDIEDNQYAYDIHIVLKDSDVNGPAANAFDFDTDKSEILKTFTDYRDTLEVSDYDATYNGCEIFARINKETNRVEWLRLVKTVNVSSDVNFTGTLSSLGETPVRFNLQENYEFYDFVWDAPTEAASAE